MKAAVEEIQASKKWIEHKELLGETVEMVEKAQNHVKKLRPILQKRAGEIAAGKLRRMMKLAMYEQTRNKQNKQNSQDRLIVLDLVLLPLIRTTTN